MPIKPLIFILNGPKDTGKDFLCEEVASEWYGVHDTIHLMFKQPLYDISAAISGLPYEDFIERATNRTLKEKPMEALGGRTPREFMIFVSEEVIKPNFGKDYFGVRMVDEISEILADIEMMEPNPPKTLCFTVSDGGFSKEIRPLVEKFGKDSVNIIHLKRDGRDYEGDSRRYLYPKDFPSVSCPDFFTELYNEEGKQKQTIDEFKTIMQNCIGSFNTSETLKELSNEN